MARLILFAVLIVCLVYVTQAIPMPQQTGEETAETIEAKLANTWNDVKNTLSQGFDKDKINEFVENGREWLNKAVETVRKEAEKVIPKSD